MRNGCRGLLHSSGRLSGAPATPQLVDRCLSDLQSIEREPFPSALAEVVARREAYEESARAKAKAKAKAKADNHREGLSTLKFRRQERQASAIG